MMQPADDLLDDSLVTAPIEPRQETSKVRPHRPPAIAADRLALTNRLSLRRTPVALTLGNAVLAFKPIGLGALDHLAQPSPRLLFWFRLDGRPLVLQMAKDLYERLMARVDPELLAADIDREILPLLLESCVEDGLARAEAGLAGRIELIAVQPGAAFDLDGPDIALEVAIDGERAGFAALRAEQDLAHRLADRFAARDKPPRSYGDLKVALSLRPGTIWLDLDTLKRLKTGDVLLAEEDASRWDRLAATVGEHWLFPLEMTRQGPKVRGPLRRADARDQEEWMMVDPTEADDAGALNARTARGQKPGPSEADAKSERAETANADPDIDAGPAAPPADAAFDDLPIKLVFEIGRLELPLGQLQEIGAGHVFQLERPLGEAVEIHAGGRRIGKGEVVRIEDQLGVRVVRLFGQSGT